MYEKEGIHVKLLQFNNGGDLMVAMASGSVDVGYVGVTPVLSSISKGVPVKIISGAQTEGSGLVVNKNSDIHSIEDLKGKKIATPGQSSIQYMLLDYALKQHGMNITDITSPAMKVSTMNDALKTGSINGMLTYEPYVSIYENKNNGREIVSSHDILNNHPCCVVVATDSFIEKHPDKVNKILKVHEQATEKLKSDPTGCVQYLPKTIVPNATIEKNVLSSMNFVSGLNDTYKDNVMNFEKIEHNMGLLSKDIPEKDIFYNQ